MSADQTFFLVWNPGGRNPGHRHATYQTATAEAERLAGSVPGAEFYVLQAVSLSRRVDVETIPLKDPIPF